MQLVGVLLHAGSKINARTARGQTSLHLAVQMHRSDVLQQLIDYGSKDGKAQPHQADLHAKDCLEITPLHVAAYVGHPDCCRILLQAGASSVLKDTGGTSLPVLGHVAPLCMLNHT